MNQAINIYQIFTRLFRNDNNSNKPFGTIEENGCSKFEHFSPKALQAIKNFGVTHIWFTGIIRHATCTDYSQEGIPKNNPQIVKGRAGSPYAITDYYDVDPDLATNPEDRMSEFEQLIERCHTEGLKVIIDFVPNHVAREYHSINQPSEIEELGASDNTQMSFSPGNNFYYIPNQQFKVPEGIKTPYNAGSKSYNEYPAKATGNDTFSAQPNKNDWYETVKLNYGVDYINNHQNHFSPTPKTWHKMLHIMRFWAQKGVDGFRCDMAEMIPVQIWQWAIPKVKEATKNILFVAEVYNPSEYKKFLNAGFDYLYDKVGLYDISRALIEGHGSARQITNLWQRYEGHSHRMLRFLENHDEQRIASSQYANNPWRAVPAMVLAATLHCGPLMIYFGQEIGEPASESEGFSGFDGRTTIFDYWCVKEYQKWVNSGEFNNHQLCKNQISLRNFYHSLNQLRLDYKAISQGGFYDLMWANSHLNLDKTYAYIRHFSGEVLLIILNFDHNIDFNLSLKIPADAIDATGLSKSGKWKATELIGKKREIDFYPNNAQNEGIAIFIPAMSAAILQISKV